MTVGGPHSPSVEELQRLDRRHLIHPHRSRSAGEPVIVTRGAGCRLWDVNGREYLDATGGLWLAQVGHGRRELAEVAHEQMSCMEYYPVFWDYSNVPAITLARRLSELAPGDLNQVFLTSGGSEGNEFALRMARLFHARRGDTERTWILARRSAYHGVGYGSGSLTGFPAHHEGFGPMLPHVRHLTPPWPYRSELFGATDPTDFLLNELSETLDEIGPHRVAAMIGEPIMGVAGMLIPPEDYWSRVRELLREHDILLIADEVVTAFGRTGNWFVSPVLGMDPDLIVTAKGLTSGYAPLGAVVIDDRIAEVLKDGSDGFPLGYTYSGHPVACSVGLANLEIIERERLLEQAARTGALLLARVQGLAELPVVGEVRGYGMMVGIELVSDKASRSPLPSAAPACEALRSEEGVIARNLGHVLALSPPLVLEAVDVETIAAALGRVLARVQPDGSLGRAVGSPAKCL